ncbi:hypothetical protein Pmar_PMAR026982 [Perkinsus marinus ATCC 50983]|uniref:SCP domain-containing protein n=1 Tax=Perkinsus marinus (strain ATCC 50983 / TXsc) TaxID=423536 RepID=C5KII0_PERM5|nr:hypothetical protein Pmar_PMAR026982 [Perkinsus marinus ATCC 50983]EER15714.1 hypothetical protein Pmar_PMAR026982 [Perkinsus marinus ATCC 50983]|eukprot:XP_002783918.1 hypothetical protein Pmar_PMAR026982 [Perkinsus marinus ATCC 50983]
MKTASVGFFVLQSTSVYGAFEEAEGIEGWVKDHNYFRCLHGAGPVEWSTELEAESQQWADHLATEGGSLARTRRLLMLGKIWLWDMAQLLVFAMALTVNIISIVLCGIGIMSITTL